MNSLFVTLWLLVSIFAGVFGVWGIIPVLIASGVFTAIQYIDGSFTFELLIQIISASVIPLIIGAIIWSKVGSGADNNEKKAYRNLANELTEVSSKSEAVINAIGDGVIVIDSKGIVQLINPAAQRLIGWGKQDALTLSYKTILHLVNQINETVPDTNNPIQQVLNTNQQIRTNEFSLMTKTDKKIMISLVISPVGGVGSGIIAVFRDITNEKTEEREQAEFISTASHEMRTPVASIEGYLGLALSPQTAQIDDRARDFIIKAHASAEHLGHLFQDLLDVSKADDGRISNNPKVLNLVTFVQEITLGLEAKAREKGLRLIYKPMPSNNALDKSIAPVYSVNLDDNHVREIVNNLIENAIKYTPKGDVVVDVTGDEDHVVINIKDQGIGIPVEDMAHLFQKFYRVNNKDTRDIGGTGLGLYLSRRLTELMGGRIWAESIYTEGSTFFVELPRISSREASLLSEKEAVINEPTANNPSAETPAAPVPEPTIPEVKQPAQAPQQEINKPVSMTETPSVNIPAQPKVEPTTTEPVLNSVPRAQALTPQQISEYVAKQHERIEQQNRAASRPQTTETPNNRLQQTVVPDRNIKK